MQTLSAMDVRKKLGEILSKVELRGEEFIIEKGGKPSAVIVPYKKIRRIRDRALQDIGEMFAQPSKKGLNRDLSDEDVENFVNQAIHESRRKK